VAGARSQGSSPATTFGDPIALYNAKVLKNQRANFAIVGKCKSRKLKKAEIAKFEIRESTKLNAKVSHRRNFCVRVNGDK